MNALTISLTFFEYANMEKYYDEIRQRLIKHYSENENLAKALSGVPTHAAWHIYRIKEVLHDTQGPLDKNSWTRWLLYDIDLFLKRCPESEAIRFDRVDLNLNFGWFDDALEELDRIVEKNGAFLKDAYQYRASLLDKVDPSAAQQDREKILELEKSGRPAPQKQEVDTLNPLDFPLEVEPFLPLLTRQAAHDLIAEERFQEVLTDAVNMESLYQTLHVYSAVAEKLDEKNQKNDAAKVLADAVALVLRETEYKSSRGRHLARIAQTQGKLIGREIAKQTLDLAVRENLQTRKKESQRSAFRDIIKVQLELALFEEAEKTISFLDDEGVPSVRWLDLADELFKHGNQAKSETLRKQIDASIPEEDDEFSIGTLLRIAESYARAGQPETARKRLSRAMDLLKYTESDFHDYMAEVAEAYYDCGMLKEFKIDIQQYADEDIEPYLQDLDDE